VLPAADSVDILSANTASQELTIMHTFIRISGDDLPCGSLLIATDTDTALEQLVDDLARAYPKSRHCVVRGMDVVADVAGDVE
jgi:hypothetical protein